MMNEDEIVENVNIKKARRQRNWLMYVEKSGKMQT